MTEEDNKEKKEETKAPEEDAAPAAPEKASTKKSEDKTKADGKEDVSGAEDAKLEVSPEAKEVVENTTEEELAKKKAKEETTVSDERLEGWKPVTTIGKMVKEGKITDIDQILDNGHLILEAEIVDALLPDLESDLLLVGQSKGKFGGGQRRIFRQTQKKTREGNKPQFLTYAVVGNRNGYVGVGYGKSKETVPAREKALRRAKLNVIKVRRGTGSWEDNSKEAHSIPFKVMGKCGSSEMTLMPAPKGKGLVIEPECGKIIALSGIKNIWSRTRGQTKTKLNLLNATFEALKNLSKMKVPHSMKGQLHLVEGRMETSAADEDAEAVMQPVKEGKK